VELRILGRVRLHMQEPVEVGPTKVRGLLGFLSWKANEYVHVDRIAEALWDGDTPADTAKALHPYASRLRRVFRDAGCPAALTNEHRSYCLNIDQSTVDFHRFTATVREAQRARATGDHRAAADLFTTALALWDGPLLADLDTPWARRLRDALTVRDLIPAQCALFDTKLALGDHEYVLNGLPAWLTDHPAEDRLAIRWIRALAAAGRTDEVPAFYRDFVNRLTEDLSATPSEELVRAVRETMTRRTLPAPVTRRPSPPRDTPYFTGRESLLTQLDALLTRAVDVVALDGPPGIGKTTLVKHWARTRQSHFPDGVLYVDLAGYSDAPLIEPHAVMAMFLAELGVNPTQVPSTTEERAAQLRDLLANRTMLVCLDNARDSNHVRPLLEATSPSPALITSRQRLTGITYRDGVQLLSTPTLPTDEATELLAKRIGSRVRHDPAAFTRLVGLCRNLPLALRIVGEHVAMRPAVPIPELADELRHTKRLLDAGSYGDDHTTTLRSTFSLSYRALPSAERRLFRLLGLHPGTSFSVQAVTALADTDDVEPVLDALVGAHLVDQEGAGRYNVHDLLHVYAADAARDDEPPERRDRAVTRLFDWYLRSTHNARMCLSAADQGVPELASTEQVDALDFADRDVALHWLAVERANLTACTHRAAELGYHEHVWRFSACLHVLNKHDDPRDLLEIHELGRRSAELAGNTAAVGGCLNNQGTIYARLDEEAKACRYFELAHREFTKVGDETGLAAAMHNLWFVRMKQGMPAEAITWLEKALAMNSRGGLESAVATGHRCLGEAYLMLEHFDEARSHYRQSLYSSQKRNDLVGQATSLSCLAKLSLDENRLPEAIAYGEEALAMFDRVQVDQDGTAAALCVLATAHLRNGAHEPAIVMAREAALRYEEIGNSSGHIDGLVLLGRALLAAGEPAGAVSTWTAAELMLPPADPRGLVIRGLLTVSAVRPVPTQRTAYTVDGQHIPEARKPVTHDIPEDVN
jgi:DNA-binding SARP family transcriptional activator/tetratricopeptide (TPR) repeat protein